MDVKVAHWDVRTSRS